MQSSNIYAGLEIGSSKVCLVVGEERDDGGIRILGVGQHPSTGVRHGEIIDQEAARTCLDQALAQAEERAGVAINTVFLSISGAHIKGHNNRQTIQVAAGEVGPGDLDEIRKKCREEKVSSDDGVLHSIIQSCSVDGQSEVANPLGIHGRKLEADVHIVHGIKTRIQNTIQCARDVPLNVEDVIFAPLASSRVVLDQEAKLRGAILLDIGGGTTDYICYADGEIVASGSVGVGGDDLTLDIARVLEVPPARAEKLKVTYGSARLEGIHPREKIPKGAEGPETLPRVLLCEILNNRLRELLAGMDHLLGMGNDEGKTFARVYLTGGSSLLTGLDDLVAETFQLPVCRTTSASLAGPPFIENPKYATPIGLIQYARSLTKSFSG